MGLFCGLSFSGGLCLLLSLSSSLGLNLSCLFGCHPLGGRLGRHDGTVEAELHVGVSCWGLRSGVRDPLYSELRDGQLKGGGLRSFTVPLGGVGGCAGAEEQTGGGQNGCGGAARRTSVGLGQSGAGDAAPITARSGGGVVSHGENLPC